MEYKMSQYSVVTEPLNDDPSNLFRIIYSTRSGVSTVISEEILNQIHNKDFSNIDSKICSKLMEAEIIVPETSNELEQILSEFEISSQNTKNLSYTITPTANCQLGCNYCGQTHKSTSIDPALEAKIEKHLKNKIDTKKYKNLDITWYGAEPLMGYKAIHSLSEKLLNLTAQNQMGYSALMITNGLSLKEKIFVDLVEKAKVKSFQITLDGVKKTHDNSRMTKQNNPTFDLIFRNIINAVNHPVYEKENCNIIVRINVSKKNCDEVPELLDLIYEKNIHDKVSIDFEPVHDWGNNDADLKIGLTNDEYAPLEVDWIIKMKQLGFKTSNLVPSRRYGTCLTTNPNDELIDADGKISYCWEVPYTEGNSSDEKLYIGDLNNEKAIYKDNYQDAPLRNWYNDIRTGKHNSHNCKTCTFLPVCGGACPISWYKGKPACPSFKYNIEERLILQYLDGKLNQA